MSDILARLAARAQGSPSCLARRIPHRFAPGAEYEEGWPGDGDALSEAIETRMDRSAPARAAVAVAAPGQAPVAAAPVTAASTATMESPATSAAQRRADRAAPAAAPAANMESPAAPTVQRRAHRAKAGPTAARPAHRVPLAGDRDEVAPAAEHLPASTRAAPMAPSNVTTPGLDDGASAPEAPAAAPERLAPVGRRKRKSTAPPLRETTAVSERPRAARPAVEAGVPHAAGADRSARPLSPSSAEPPAHTRSAAATDVARSSTLEGEGLGRPAAQRRRSAQAKLATSTAPEDQHVHREPGPVEPSRPVAPAPGRTMPQQKKSIAHSIAAPAVQRRENAAIEDASPGSARLPVSAPRGRVLPPAAAVPAEPASAPAVQRRKSAAMENASSSRLPIGVPRSRAPTPAATSLAEHLAAPAGPTERTAMRQPAMQASAPAAPEYPPPLRQATRDRAVDRLAPSQQSADEAVRQRGDERLPARSFPETRRWRAPEAAPTAPAAAKDIHIDIGNIRIELPRARPRRARPEPPPLQGKPRRGPDG